MCHGSSPRDTLNGSRCGACVILIGAYIFFVVRMEYGNSFSKGYLETMEIRVIINQRVSHSATVVSTQQLGGLELSLMQFGTLLSLTIDLVT